jgi:hypothetical protein
MADHSQNPIKGWTTGSITFSQLTGHFGSPLFTYAASHPGLSSLWADISAARAVLTALFTLKGLRVPYVVLVKGIDEVADAAFDTEVALDKLELATSEALAEVAKKDYLPRDNVFAEIEKILANHVVRSVELITSLSCKHHNKGRKHA